MTQLKNTIRDRYFVVKILFKKTVNKLEDSQEQAQKKFLSLEQKLNKHPKLKYTNIQNSWNKTLKHYEIRNSKFNNFYELNMTCIGTFFNDSSVAIVG